MNQATITHDIITQVIAAIPTPQAPVVNVTAAAPPQSTHSMRLPQRQIKHFKGDILEWTQLWESLNAAIHSSTLTNVQKFDYLKEYLKGEAISAADARRHSRQLRLLKHGVCHTVNWGCRLQDGCEWRTRKGKKKAPQTPIRRPEERDDIY
ncbi:Uncharacterized protein APZ42_009243 [Daphnia magna]|uniref:Uncharacterized protein n=1 Tax=Daphnia magna TaxID=35525 RepID=A0A162CZ56_9CRUS|nr:Uncharacterized protein APZ42_009243 [Daphnia magna]